jgi:prevent-host-death family protein
MTIQMNLAEAKAKLSALIEAAERGESVIIARNGEPVATLTALKAAPKNRIRLGIARELYGWSGPVAPLEAFAADEADLEWIETPLVSGKKT